MSEGMPKPAVESGDKKKKVGGLRALLFGAGALTAVGATQPAEAAGANALQMPVTGAASLDERSTSPKQEQREMTEQEQREMIQQQERDMTLRDTKFELDQHKDNMEHHKKMAEIEARIRANLEAARESLGRAQAGVERAQQHIHIPEVPAETTPDTPAAAERQP